MIELIIQRKSRGEANQKQGISGYLRFTRVLKIVSNLFKRWPKLDHPMEIRLKEEITSLKLDALREYLKSSKSLKERQGNFLKRWLTFQFGLLEFGCLCVLHAYGPNRCPLLSGCLAAHEMIWLRLMLACCSRSRLANGMLGFSSSSLGRLVRPKRFSRVEWLPVSSRPSPPLVEFAGELLASIVWTIFQVCVMSVSGSWVGEVIAFDVWLSI